MAEAGAGVFGPPAAAADAVFVADGVAAVAVAGVVALVGAGFPSTMELLRLMLIFRRGFDGSEEPPLSCDMADGFSFFLLGEKYGVSRRSTDTIRVLSEKVLVFKSLLQPSEQKE